MATLFAFYKADFCTLVLSKKVDLCTLNPLFKIGVIMASVKKCNCSMRGGLLRIGKM